MGNLGQYEFPCTLPRVVEADHEIAVAAVVRMVHLSQHTERTVNLLARRWLCEPELLQTLRYRSLARGLGITLQQTLLCEIVEKAQLERRLGIRQHVALNLVLKAVRALLQAQRFIG